MSDSAEGLLNAGETMGRFVDLAAGHKARAINAGFDRGPAELMAVQFHGVLMERIKVEVQKGKKVDVEN